MPNTILKHDLILKDMAREFVNQTPTVQSLSKTYDGSFEAYGAKAGDAIRIDLPVRYTARTGMTRSNQDHIERGSTLVKSEVFGVDIEFTQKELALDLPTFSKEIVKPMMATVGSEVERYVQRVMAIGAGSAVTLPVGAVDREDLLAAKVLLDENAAPTSNRFLTLTPRSQGQLINNNATLFNPSADVSRQYLEGSLGRAYGFEAAMTNCPHVLVRGAANGAYVTTAIVASGNVIPVSTGTGNIQAGDKFTFPGIFSVNPITKVSTGVLKQFTAATNFAGAAGNITITETIFTSGPYQNVSAQIPSGAALTVFGTAGVNYPINLAYNGYACAFGSALMAKPDNATSATYKAGKLAFSLTSDYEIGQHRTLWRFDILCGAVVAMPEHIVAIHGVG